ncbi:MAG: hypothetical protein KY475_15925, partial [Planctomycetes bacterium]|nr:hypothetical protein [Planctomycetota bacterium]
MRIVPHLAAAVVLAVLAGAGLAVDVRLVPLCQEGHIPGDLARVLRWSEVFAHGGGAAVVLLVAWTDRK